MLRWQHDFFATSPHEPTTSAPSRSSRFAASQRSRGTTTAQRREASKRQTLHLSTDRCIPYSLEH
eukprot:1893423-Pleurochrysis_carterae.AAC.1